MMRLTKIFGTLLMAIVLSFATTVEAAPDWNTNTIQATGMGVAPPNAMTSAHAAMLARRAAVVDAYRQLAEMIQGVQVDAETTVEQMMVTSDVVKAKISAIIKGARVVSEGPLAGGGYSVTMEIPLFGASNSLAGAVIERPMVIEPIPAPSPSYTPAPVPTPVPTPVPAPVPTPAPPQPSSSHGYTGLIVDCRGLGSLNPVMSPVIFDANMRTIYGHKNLDYDRVIKEGMAAYARDNSQAVRAGSNPLIVRAIGIDDFRADPILSMEDTDLVLYENSVSHFLENLAVVFLY